MSTKIKVVAVVVTTDTITLYKHDASSEVIRQGDPITRHIVDKVIPEVDKQGFAEVDLDSFREDQQNLYTDFEKKSGIVKFFSVAKAKIAEFFSNEPEELAPTQVGVIPTKSSDKEVLDEVMAHAKPSNAHDFTDEENEDTTVVAVVDDKVIPNAQHLNRHIEYANASSPKALENFLKRLATVIDKRGHSVDDLLKFLKSADLPIAEDGRVIAYKNLYTKDDHYVDIHSKNVTQGVGYRVCVPIKLVDPNRRQDCSNGLHIANPSYLSGFGGHVCVMVKVAPEDFIAVPQYSTNKARVCRYDILATLTEDQRRVVFSCKPITEAKGGQKLLDAAVSGKLDKMHTQTTVKAHMGANLEILPIAQGSEPKKEAKPKPEPKVKAKPLPTETAPVTKNAGAPKIDPKTIKEKPLSARQRIEKILDGKSPNQLTKEDIADILAIKKKAKKSLAKLGVPSKYHEVIK